MQLTLNPCIVDLVLVTSLGVTAVWGHGVHCQADSKDTNVTILSKNAWCLLTMGCTMCGVLRRQSRVRTYSLLSEISETGSIHKQSSEAVPVRVKELRKKVSQRAWKFTEGFPEKEGLRIIK